MSKDKSVYSNPMTAKKKKTIRTNNHEILMGRKPARHKNKNEKRTKDKLRREMNEW